MFLTAEKVATPTNGNFCVRQLGVKRAKICVTGKLKVFMINFNSILLFLRSFETVCIMFAMLYYPSA